MQSIIPYQIKEFHRARQSIPKSRQNKITIKMKYQLQIKATRDQKLLSEFKILSYSPHPANKWTGLIASRRSDYLKRFEISTLL